MKTEIEIYVIGEVHIFNDDGARLFGMMTRAKTREEVDGEIARFLKERGNREAEARVR